tara:strand:+ start:723 stop:1139 length:417 start_codon:yes stop_codon:yes gene_type:complete
MKKVAVLLVSLLAFNTINAQKDLQFGILATPKNYVGFAIDTELQSGFIHGIQFGIQKKEDNIYRDSNNVSAAIRFGRSFNRFSLIGAMGIEFTDSTNPKVSIVAPHISIAAKFKVVDIVSISLGGGTKGFEAGLFFGL